MIIIAFLILVICAFYGIKYYHNRNKSFTDLYSQDELEEFDEWKNNYIKDKLV